jgi:hypothetical protein
VKTTKRKVEMIRNLKALKTVAYFLGTGWSPWKVAVSIRNNRNERVK